MNFTMTQQHTWVMHTITPVEVVGHDDKGEPVVVVDPDQVEIANDHVVYGCSTCGQAMVDVHDQPCIGEEEPYDDED